MPNFFKRKWVVIAAIVAASFGSFAFVDSYFELSKNIEIFVSMYKEINTLYVEEVDPNKFVRTGIEAMLKSLDPYTNYISEQEVEDFRFMTTGQYGGVGALISQRGDSIIVVDPYEGLPAQKSGLMTGDVILDVDGKSTKGANSEDISKMMKGQAGTSVKITVRRPYQNKVQVIQLKREEINLKSVTWSGLVSNNVGLIRLDGFKPNAGKEVSDAFLELKTKNNITSLILDLRSNPGGSLDEAVFISGLFIPKGSIAVETKGKNKQWDKTYRTMNDPIDLNMPITVLVNDHSASASEIVSGVIQDYDRGVVIGQKTYGKGLVQIVKPLVYNTQLKVTTAKYYTPSGRCVQAINYGEEDLTKRLTPDSLRHAFKTKNGRTVYDAGGVSPEIKVVPEEISDISLSLLSKSLIFDFATYYKFLNPTISSSRNFKLSNEEYEKFKAFIKDKNYDYVTDSEKMLSRYKEEAKKEKYFEGVEKEFDALQKKLAHDKDQDILKHKEEIVMILEQEIVSRYYYQNGRFEAGFSTDKELKEALNLLSNIEKYKQILAGTKKI